MVLSFVVKETPAVHNFCVTCTHCILDLDKLFAFVQKDQMTKQYHYKEENPSVIVQNSLLLSSNSQFIVKIIMLSSSIIG